MIFEFLYVWKDCARGKLMKVIWSSRWVVGNKAMKSQNHPWVNFRFGIVQVHLLGLWNHRIRPRISDLLVQGPSFLQQRLPHTFHPKVSSHRELKAILLCAFMLWAHTLTRASYTKKFVQNLCSLRKSDHAVCKSMAHGHTSQFWNQFVLFQSCNCMHFVLKFWRRMKYWLHLFEEEGYFVTSQTENL